MDLDRYQRDAARTALFPDSETGNAQALSYVALGLTGEAGEVADKVKKILRDNDGEVTSAVCDRLVDELGDVLWYLAQFATELGLDLTYVAERNLYKLNSRFTRGTIQGSGDNR